MPKAPADSIHQLRVTLRDVHPPVWRRIQVRSDITLAQLHRVLQEVMGWEDSHLHEFAAGGRCYGVPDTEEFGDKPESEARVRLGQVARRRGARLLYLYDFGDSWEHDIVVEDILPTDAAAHYPVCLEGRRATPPEDCGGLGGYEEFLAAIGD